MLSKLAQNWLPWAQTAKMAPETPWPGFPSEAAVALLSPSSGGADILGVCVWGMAQQTPLDTNFPAPPGVRPSRPVSAHFCGLSRPQQALLWPDKATAGAAEATAGSAAA